MAKESKKTKEEITVQTDKSFEELMRMGANFNVNKKPVEIEFTKDNLTSETIAFLPTETKFYIACDREDVQILTVTYSLSAVTISPTIKQLTFSRKSKLISRGSYAFLTLTISENFNSFPLKIIVYKN